MAHLKNQFQTGELTYSGKDESCKTVKLKQNLAKVMETMFDFSGDVLSYAKREVWPDWAISCTLGNFLNPVAIIILPKLPTFFAIFVKASKTFIFLGKSFLGNFLQTFGDFLLVTTVNQGYYYFK